MRSSQSTFSQSNGPTWLFWGFLTATAAGIYIVESLIMRVVPLPFIRLGLSNIVILYLVWHRQLGAAILVNIAKSVIGGIVTFTLLSPAILLSIGGGLTAILGMSLALMLRPRFSVFGISIVGAICHNLAQLILVRYIIIEQSGVFLLTPILIFFGLISGLVTAYILVHLEKIIPDTKAKHENKETKTELK